MKNKAAPGRAAFAVLGLSLGLGFCGLSPAWAASPEFSKTPEQWQKLRDDRLEFDEIAELVHEYNNQVIQNQIAYRKERGEDLEDISEDYYEAARDIEDWIQDPDPDDAGYAGAVSAALNSRIQAESLRKQGDENLDDGEIKKLGYDKEEARLVRQAQEMMIDFWNQTWSLENAEAAVKEAQASCRSEQVKLQAGLSTNEALLAVKGEADSARAALETACSDLELTRQKLCLMLGWPYGAQVDIGPVLAADPAALQSVDLEGDVARALTANYDIKITEKRLGNSRSSSAKASQEQRLKSQREAVAGSVREAYDQYRLAKTEYESALAARDSSQKDQESAQRMFQAGLMPAKEFDTCARNREKAERQEKIKGLELLKAQLQYQWAVDGLADSE